MPVQCVCQNPACATTFVSFPAKIARGAGKYCSPRCYQVVVCLPWEMRFWAKVQRCIHEEWCPFCCWEWQGARSKSGHGRFHFSKLRTSVVSRLALEMANGHEIPAHLNANHWCHNPACCNPWHLYVGTQQQNMFDMCKRYGFMYRTTQNLKERRTRTTGRKAGTVRRGTILAKNYFVSPWCQLSLLLLGMERQYENLWVWGI